MFALRVVCFCVLLHGGASALVNSKRPQKRSRCIGMSASGLPSLAFIKQFKTGGSTFSGVLRRIGAKRGYAHVRDGDWLTPCGPCLEEPNTTSVWADHGLREDMEPLIKLHLSNAIYLTSVRDPVSRCMSQYYHFDVGRHGADPHDAENKVRYSETCGSDFQFQTMQQFEGQPVRQAFEAYDFVLVTERFDESLLALRHVLACKGLNVSGGDLLYLKSKQSGSMATGDQDDFVTMPTHPSIDHEPAQVRRALQANVAGGKDARILHLANAALDKFHISPTLLMKFQEKLRLVEEQCGYAAGEDCFWNDNGCGQSCIDGLVSQYDWP